MSRRRRYPRVCAHPECPATIPHTDTYCPAHKPAPWAGSTRRTTLPPDWPRRRLIRLEIDGHTCTEPGCDAPATEVDHEIPHAEGGTDEIDNLRSKCTPHHRRKTQAEAAAGRRRARG